VCRTPNLGGCETSREKALGVVDRQGTGGLGGKTKEFGGWRYRETFISREDEKTKKGGGPFVWNAGRKKGFYSWDNRRRIDLESRCVLSERSVFVRGGEEGFCKGGLLERWENVEQWGRRFTALEKGGEGLVAGRVVSGRSDKGERGESFRAEGWVTDGRWIWSPGVE